MRIKMIERGAWRVPTEHLSRGRQSWARKTQNRNVQICNLAVSGVDGVGVISPFFHAFFPLFSCSFPLFFTLFSPCSSLFSSSPKGQGQTTAIYWKMGNFTPTPSAPTPLRTSPTVHTLNRSRSCILGASVASGCQCLL